MGMLILAALVWLVLHLGLAGTRLRDGVAARLGEGGFRGLFSGLSIAAIIFLVASYNAAPTTALWVAPGWLRWLVLLLMLPAFMLFVAALRGNPTAIGGPALAAEPRGIQRITRHPMLWSFALWAGLHMLANGDSASLVFFGAFLVTALAGMPSIDAKLARRDPRGWEALAARTSVLPFGAILAGRNRLALTEIGWAPLFFGLLLFSALLHAHAGLFGVSPLPPR